mmetsp:Transcript_16470/g.47348  ORF Transcript_16470/g.47348 Transcript_16470/m.47348 type:complete len:316 (+) Transcript_16470:94-1041(+)
MLDRTMALRGAALLRTPMNFVREIVLISKVGQRFVISQRSFSDDRHSNYIDDWHAATMKPMQFYESQSAPGRKQKNYFYSIDLQGRVFLEDVLPKNIATSLKNEKFLDFFFRRMKRAGMKERAILEDIGHEWGFSSLADDYPFVSPCGAELNFVRPADTAIVFHSMNDKPYGGWDLIFGSTLSQPFSPKSLFISKHTGRIYHEISAEIDEGREGSTLNNGVSGVLNVKPKLIPLHTISRREFGLIKSSLAVSLSEDIIDGNEEQPASLLTEKQHSGMDFACPETGNRYAIFWLPEEAEAGSWALPHDEVQDVSFE